MNKNFTFTYTPEQIREMIKNQILQNIAHENYDEFREYEYLFVFGTESDTGNIHVNCQPEAKPKIDYSGLTKEEFVKATLHENPDSRGMTYYDHIHLLFRQNFGTNVRYEGYDYVNDERGLTFSLSKDSTKADLHKMHDTLDLFNKYKKFRTPGVDDELGHVYDYGVGDYKEYSIFEDTCAEEGCLSLIYDANGRWHITLLRYHRPSLVHSTATLMDALEYIKDHHPYN